MRRLAHRLAYRLTHRSGEECSATHPSRKWEQGGGRRPPPPPNSPARRREGGEFFMVPARRLRAQEPGRAPHALPALLGAPAGLPGGNRSLRPLISLRAWGRGGRRALPAFSRPRRRRARAGQHCRIRLAGSIRSVQSGQLKPVGSIRRVRSGQFDTSGSDVAAGGDFAMSAVTRACHSARHSAFRLPGPPGPGSLGSGHPACCVAAHCPCPSIATPGPVL